jgi:hypothetical protein
MEKIRIRDPGLTSQIRNTDMWYGMVFKGIYYLVWYGYLPRLPPARSLPEGGAGNQGQGVAVGLRLLPARHVRHLHPCIPGTQPYKYIERDVIY